jgi:hypothetical protein
LENATQHDTATNDSTDSLDLCLCCDHDGFDSGFDAGWEDGKEFGLIKGAFESGKIARYDEDRAADVAEDEDEDEATTETAQPVWNPALGQMMVCPDPCRLTDADYKFMAFAADTDIETARQFHAQHFHAKADAAK